MSNNSIHPHGYWLDTRPAGHFFDSFFARAIVAEFRLAARNNGEVADFGCGKGQYVRALRESEISAIGIDGNPHVKEMFEPDAICQDLAVEFDLGRTFMYSLCIEVGEHIPKRFQDVLLDTLVRHTEQEMVLTWAVPGQAGRGHVNCQPNAAIVAEMQRRGWRYRKRISERMRRIAQLGYLKHTIMVFAKVGRK
jgi:tryptophanyl-tRNA synthetase